MEEFNGDCVLCGGFIHQSETGEPFLLFKGKAVCSSCYMDIVPEIYKMSGTGDGGMIHIVFRDLFQSSHNRKRRKQICRYREIFNSLLHKYKFSCVNCGAKDKLTIDHIIPVSKGGTDAIKNLQIMCKSCNSSKGNRI